MHSEKIKKIAAKEMPSINVIIHEEKYRHNVVDSLEGNFNIGIELGVAQGIFSRRMIDSNKFSKFFGVDVYGDTHDTNEYKVALKRIGIKENYSLLRMKFDEAIDLFEDGYFDFIYVDGFAHSGEEGGRTLVDWYKKLKVGGVMAGDDYSDEWPLVKWAVNNFAKQLNVDLNITGRLENQEYCYYPSWFFIKKGGGENLILNSSLVEIGDSERVRINNMRMAGKSTIAKILTVVLDLIGIKEAVKSVLIYFKIIRRS